MKTVDGIHGITPDTCGRAFGWQEEGFCPACGNPVMEGDRVFQIVDTFHPEADFVECGFCSRKCAGDYIRGSLVAA